MEARDLPDLDALALELVQTERRSGELERRLVILQDRQSTFPNDFSGRSLAQLTLARDEMRTRMDILRAQLLPLMRHQ